MATWTEQLQNIQSLREQRRLTDERLYATKINLSKTENLLLKARELQTELTAHREVQPLRERIQTLESQLQETGKETSDVARVSLSIQKQRNLTEFLQKKISAQESQINILRRRLEEEQRKPDPARD